MTSHHALCPPKYVHARECRAAARQEKRPAEVFQQCVGLPSRAQTSARLAGRPQKTSSESTCVTDATDAIAKVKKNSVGKLSIQEIASLCLRLMDMLRPTCLGTVASRVSCASRERAQSHQNLHGCGASIHTRKQTVEPRARPTSNRGNHCAMSDHLRSTLGPSWAENKPAMPPELGQSTPNVRATRIAQPARTRRKRLTAEPSAHVTRWASCTHS